MKDVYLIIEVLSLLKRIGNYDCTADVFAKVSVAIQDLELVVKKNRNMSRLGCSCD